MTTTTATTTTSSTQNAELIASAFGECESGGPSAWAGAAQASASTVVAAASRVVRTAVLEAALKAAPF